VCVADLTPPKERSSRKDDRSSGSTNDAARRLKSAVPAEEK
jgi:hypothetical protein